MRQIVPTITAVSPNEFARELEKLDFAKRIHIDITDGKFAPNQTINLNQIYWNENKKIDLHLMMNEPQKWLHQIIALNPELVILHAEIENSREILPKIREYLAKFNIKFGLAILPKTQIEQIPEMLKIADHVLIFGGNLGFQGGKADLNQLKKSAEIRKINSTCEIAWDGGANTENIAEIAQNKVEIINVGSAIAKSENPEKSYEKMVKIASEIS